MKIKTNFSFAAVVTLALFGFGCFDSSHSGECS